jgi:transcriptional regulator with XRE-family HTH domain
MTFGEILKEARTELGLTQGEVASECGIHASMVCDYENDEHQPAFETALKLSKYLGIPLDDYKQTISIPADYPRLKSVRLKQPH